MTSEAEKAVGNNKTVLYEYKAQAPPPSKHYHQVVVNELGVIFRSWKIDPAHGIHHADLGGSSTQTVATTKEFIDHEELQSSIEKIFGEDVLRQAVEAVSSS
eukprot:TRINITY_DN6539_c0_g1_i2.p1 TRINITY_DN6539_c0_g1~~TRINITY_DN6539_c0_g1_i2.p1  ORF type:complete len:102 (+),score=17.91 TRINITY_DN6539_c0_g1_i2:66-371(+)